MASPDRYSEALLVAHPWSRGAPAELPAAGPRRLTAEQRRQFAQQGYLLLEDAVAPDLLAEVMAAIDPLERQLEEVLRGRPEGRIFIAEADVITFTPNLTARSATLRRFASSRLFRDLAHDLLGPDVRLFWDQAVYKKPSSKVFPCHQDNGYGFVDPESYLTCWVALSDSPPEAGGPRVFPGLHRRGTLRHRLGPDGFVLPLDWREGAAVPLRAGSVLAFSSLLPHATGPNATDHVRRAFVLQYTSEDAAYLRGDPESALPPAREPVRDLPPERQWLLLRDGEAVSDRA